MLLDEGGGECKQMKPLSETVTPDGCELCGDNKPPFHIHAHCHLTAPLRAELENSVLTLFCYLPECNRVVARFKLRVEKQGL